MNNTTLVKRKEDLLTRRQELIDQAESVDKSILQLQKDRETIVANFNAITGAIQLITELIETPSEDCGCQVINQ